jgi:hypothetical protein
MDCKMNQETLIDFHFGNLDIDTRSAMEGHLLGCAECLQEYFLLKRDVESAHAVALRPAGHMKQEITREFSAYSNAKIQEQQQQRWLQAHPKKLIFGGLVAAAALILILFTGQNNKLTESSKVESAPKTEMIRSLDETVDSGGSNPGHINII